MMIMMMIMVMKAGDSGVYECQVSTTPVMSHHVILHVAGNGITTVRTGYCPHIVITLLECMNFPVNPPKWRGKNS